MTKLSALGMERFSVSSRFAASRGATLTAIATLAVTFIAIAALTTIGSARAFGGGRPAVARSAAMAQSAHVLDATDTAHLRYISSSGSLLHEEGLAVGTLPGKMLAHLNIGPTVSASFTIYVRGGGTITGHGTGTPHGSGIYESFAGSLVATGGTGRYAHAHGHAGLYGVFNRRSYAVTVQTTGRLAY